MAQKTKTVCYLEYASVKIAMTVFLLLPYSLALKAGSLLGSLFFHLLSKRRELTINNLSRYLSSRPAPENEATALSVYKNIGKTLLEFIRSAKMNKEELLSLVEVEGKENLEGALLKGKGVILLSAHFGNWELVGQVLSALGFKLNVLARALDNPLLDGVVNGIRSRFGTRVIANANSIKDVIRALRRNESVGILIDQNLYENAVFVDFLGRTAATTPIVPLLVQKIQTAIIPVHSERQNNGKHKIILGKELIPQDVADRQEYIRINTRVCNEVIESWVKKIPEQWFWVHNRWKTQPVKDR